jgi:hypothetical protein
MKNSFCRCCWYATRRCSNVGRVDPREVEREHLADLDRLAILDAVQGRAAAASQLEPIGLVSNVSSAWTWI